jgi:uncharacterized protein YfkK (UPF0435 family)
MAELDRTENLKNRILILQEIRDTLKMLNNQILESRIQVETENGNITIIQENV